MLIREVREWINKVERGQYSYEDAMSELLNFSRFLTKEELIQLTKRIKSSYKA